MTENSNVAPHIDADPQEYTTTWYCFRHLTNFTFTIKRKFIYTGFLSYLKPVWRFNWIRIHHTFWCNAKFRQKLHFPIGSYIKIRA